MSDKFTKQEKTAIALKAASGDEKTIQQLAKKHNVSEDEIKMWVRETEVSGVEEQHDHLVSIQATNEFANTVKFGATKDNLNYKRLIFWSMFGTAVFTIFTVAIIFLYGYTFPGVERVRSEASQFYNIQQMEQANQSHLESFGVVDPDNGIYRIPVDSAISQMAEDL